MPAKAGIQNSVIASEARQSHGKFTLHNLDSGSSAGMTWQMVEYYEHFSQMHHGLIIILENHYAIQS